MSETARPSVSATESAGIEWSPDGVLRSRLYDDVYFSRQDGLAETRAVFLDGCGLPQAWQDRHHFTVAELGFGSGLNVIALLDLWRQTRQAGAHLSIFSLEAHPISREDAARVHQEWPDLAPISQDLLELWPGQALGLHRIDLPGLDASLDLYIGAAADALHQWTGMADAWFLDGFSPSRNPDMWSAALLEKVAAHSRPGTRLASFTVAGQVRRDLARFGFEVAKRPGFGRKRERLEAGIPGDCAVPERDPATLSVAIIGAGIAGAAVARAFRAARCRVDVFDAKGPAGGASGNAAALVAPRLDAGEAAPSRFFARAFARARQLILQDRPGSVIGQGSLQLAQAPRDRSRFERLAQSRLFEPGELNLVEPHDTASRLGGEAVSALDISSSLIVRPVDLVSHWCGSVQQVEVAGLERSGDGWLLKGPSNQIIARSDVVVVCAGLNSQLFAPLNLRAVRGQLEWATDTEWSHEAASFGGYVIPAPDGLVFGATHDRDDEGLDSREQDRLRNLQLMAPLQSKMDAALIGATVTSRASIRAASQDQNPVAGEVAPGLYVLTGLGSRGFCSAPILGEHIAAQALGRPSPLENNLQAFVDPNRFADRQARRDPKI
jgi:tRNA 5-methylaminomethyl-2-thiouridine biosynthesis bifunctional protein